MVVVMGRPLWFAADVVCTQRIDVFRDESLHVHTATKSCSEATHVCGHHAASQCNGGGARQCTRNNKPHQAPTPDIVVLNKVTLNCSGENEDIRVMQCKVTSSLLSCEYQLKRYSVTHTDAHFIVNHKNVGIFQGGRFSYYLISINLQRIAIFLKMLVKVFVTSKAMKAVTLSCNFSKVYIQVTGQVLYLEIMRLLLGSFSIFLSIVH